MESTAMQRHEDVTTEELIAERRMWTAVMIHGEEWLNGPLQARRTAQEFLFEDNDDFCRVCAFAGLDPTRFRSKLLRVGRRVEMRGALAQPIAA